MKLSWRPLSVMACALLPLAMSGCASSSYMGISLAPGTADPTLQQLARKARIGDKQAQLELGIAFEDGTGIGRDLSKARKLYRIAANDSGGSKAVYVPAAAGVAGRSVTVGDTVKRPGLIEASQRLQRINEKDSISNQGSLVFSDKEDRNRLLCHLIHIVQSESTDAALDFRSVLLEEVANQNPSIISLQWSSEAVSNIFGRPMLIGEESSSKYQAYLMSSSGDCSIFFDTENQSVFGFELSKKPMHVPNGELTQRGDIFDTTALMHDTKDYSLLIHLSKHDHSLVYAIAVIWE